jgi:adenine-specific DNA-methyltransferase
MMGQQTETEDDLLAENQRLRERLSKFERNGGFGLVWENIPEAVEQQLVDEVPVLKHIPSLDVAGENPSPSPHVLIEGDNLHALHVLQATHRGKVDVIYIDPPYNTGNRDFVYNDRFIDAESEYRHSAWLSFMEKRLRLARELLKDTGVIFISIDDNEHSRLRLLLNQIFGDDDCLGDIAIVNNLRGRSDSSHFATAHESLLVFARDARKSKLNGFPLTDSQVSEYKMEDSISRFKPETLRKRGSNSRREDAPSLFYPIYWNEKKDTLSLDKTNNEDIEILPYLANGEEGNWRWGRDTFLERKGTELLVITTKGSPTIYVKMRLEGRTSKPKTIWLDPKYDSSAGTRLIKQLVTHSFNNPKPLEYITDILQIGGGRDALVLDFFAGSGTILHAVAELNALDGGSRRCILVTNNENDICREVTQPRIKAVLTGDWASGPHNPLPGSLAFYQTDFAERLDTPDFAHTDMSCSIM